MGKSFIQNHKMIPQQFVALWKFGSPLSDPNGTRVKSAFSTRLTESPCSHPWHLNDEFIRSGRGLLVGVSTYAFNDMFLLDWLETHAKGSLEDPRIDVIDLSEVHSDADLADCFDGRKMRTMTPVVGLWLDGRLVDLDFGAFTLPFVERILISNDD